MKRINRWVVVVRPRSPFYDWANSLQDDQPRLTPAEFIGDATVLLIPDQRDRDSADGFMTARFERVFEHFLNLRVDDPLVWPQGRSLEMFNAWFEVEIHQNAMDVAEERIKVREF